MISVTCVTDDGTFPSEYYEMFDTMCTVCTENGFALTLRAFDSWRYASDRDEITKLPAFHISINGIRRATTYPDDLPFEKLDACIDECKARERERMEARRTKGSWIRNIVSYSSIFKRVMRVASADSVEEWANPIRRRPSIQ